MAVFVKESELFTAWREVDGGGRSGIPCEANELVEVNASALALTMRGMVASTFEADLFALLPRVCVGVWEGRRMVPLCVCGKQQ